jgi:hypothetical protein
MMYAFVYSVYLWMSVWSVGKHNLYACMPICIEIFSVKILFLGVRLEHTPYFPYLAFMQVQSGPIVFFSVHMPHNSNFEEQIEV